MDGDLNTTFFLLVIICHDICTIIHDEVAEMPSPHWLFYYIHTPSCWLSLYFIYFVSLFNLLCNLLCKLLVMVSGHVCDDRLESCTVLIEARANDQFIFALSCELMGLGNGSSMGRM